MSNENNLMYKVCDFVYKASHCLLYGATSEENKVHAATLERLMEIRDKHKPQPTERTQSCPLPSTMNLRRSVSKTIKQQAFFNDDTFEIYENDNFVCKEVDSKDMEVAILEERRQKLIALFPNNQHMVEKLLKINEGK